MPSPDPSRFVELLIEHQSDLLRSIIALVGNLTDAQDVYQDSAKAMWQKFDQYDPQRPFLPWARQFARNEALMFHRKKHSFTFLSEELINQLAQEHDERESVDRERSRALRSCLRKLPQEDQKLIRRRYDERELTVQELAAEFGKTSNALYKHLGRIRAELLKCIETSMQWNDAKKGIT
ncbi:sigma-70 family RNA polymerase sigma factor [Neorhodopirellula pilleata]|uniref:RNA polymerase sigma factor CnrH n=1 Tax=Neorhodopirellula pilleata TaxID=2714738 RepID=A0A5C6ADJ1_9BACT|nr:sigma-70 family RNA polymerase sigma factor [Neorhodopirellula pilleata]TWT96313.1 RNA polymerase sigma factor CnrH [Neorhodopirellula pilleata]